MIGHLECSAVNKQNLFVKLFCLQNVKLLAADIELNDQSGAKPIEAIRAQSTLRWRAPIS